MWQLHRLVILSLISVTLANDHEDQMWGQILKKENDFIPIHPKSQVNTEPPFPPKLHWTGPDPDLGKTTPEIIQMRGWGVETHYVITPDGYHLAMHRIVDPKGNVINGTKRPIILQHGLFSSSMCWVINDPNTGFYGEKPDNSSIGNNLGFELAKRGYDVWMPNIRGNKYSRNHTTFKVDSKQFWDFSFDDFIRYDSTSFIAYVRNVTKSEKVGWVGHSQGTMMMFGLLSRYPQYSNVVEPFIALAPVAYTGNVYGPIKFVAHRTSFLNILYFLGGPFPKGVQIPAIAAMFCPHRFLNYACLQATFLFAGGYESTQLNYTRMAIYLGDESGTTSIKNLYHFAQNVRTDNFQSFDYGRKGNLAHYDSEVAPLYHIQNINSTSIAIISSVGDFLGDAKDVTRLLKDLNVPLINHWKVVEDKFSHLDFIWGNQAGEFVYRHVIDVLAKTVV